MPQKKQSGGGTVRASESEFEDAIRRGVFRFGNTNAEHVPGDGTAVFDNGVFVVYGNDDFRDQASVLEKYDKLFGYVNVGETEFGGVAGLAEVGSSVTATPVSDADSVYSGHVEYHVNCRWLAVPPETQRVTPGELRDILGRGHPRGTVQNIAKDYRKGAIKLARELYRRAQQ